jgi:DNA-directed RNA polymerase specialized sigma54-like protein
MKKFTIKEIADDLQVSERTVLRQIQTISDKLKNPYSKGFLIDEDLKNLIFSDKFQTNSDSENEDFPYVEYFTADEYEEFKKRITEYPFLKEQIESSKQHLETMDKQIEYFRFSYNKQLEIHEKLIDTFRERNYIEAKEKGLDK